VAENDTYMRQELDDDMMFDSVEGTDILDITIDIFVTETPAGISAAALR